MHIRQTKGKKQNSTSVNFKFKPLGQISIILKPHWNNFLATPLDNEIKDHIFITSFTCWKTFS